MIGTDENRAVLYVEVIFWSGKRKMPPRLMSGKYCPHFVVTGTMEYLGVCFLDGDECIFDEPALGNAQPLYLKALEPEEWHNEQEKARQLTPYKLPAKLVEYLKTGPLRLEFPERELVKWAELYPYMDVQEMTWKRKKLLSLMAKMDNYSDYLLLWSPRDKKLWYLDIEHKEFHPLAKWEEFIADPGKYLNGMIEGEFEE